MALHDRRRWMANPTECDTGLGPWKVREHKTREGLASPAAATGDDGQTSSQSRGFRHALYIIRCTWGELGALVLGWEEAS